MRRDNSVKQVRVRGFLLGSQKYQFVYGGKGHILGHYKLYVVLKVW